MQCPFCGKEGEPVEATTDNRVECRCPHCQSLVGAYIKGMEPTLKNLISLERFKGGTQ